MEGIIFTGMWGGNPVNFVDPSGLVDLNLYDKKSPFHDPFNKVRSDPALEFSVAGPFDSDNFTFAGLSPAQLAKRLMCDRRYKFAPSITLYSTDLIDPLYVGWLLKYTRKETYFPKTPLTISPSGEYHPDGHRGKTPEDDERWFHMTWEDKKKKR